MSDEVKNEVVNLGLNLPAGISDEELAQEAGSGDWLPRVSIVDAKNDLAINGEIKAGNLALFRSKEDADDLTPQIDCIILDARHKALDISVCVLESHDPESDLYKRIKKDSAVADSGCLYGPEFLIWVASVKKFATFFCSSKTARRESGKISALRGCAATLRTVRIKSAKYSWFGPKISQCSTPFEVPSQEVILEQIEKFRNPPIAEVEEVKEDGGRAR